MVFGFFSRNNVEPVVEEKKIWNNDVRPSFETTRARFRIHKQIRDGDVPELRPIPLTLSLPPIIASYKKGTADLVENNIERIDSPSDDLEEGEVVVSENELRPHTPPTKKNKKRRKRKRRRTD